MPKTKSDVLKEHGWEEIIGYTFEYDKDESFNNIVISREEVERFFKQEPKSYWWHPDREYCIELDDAWETFCEDYQCEHDLDMTEEEFDKKMLC